MALSVRDHMKLEELNNSLSAIAESFAASKADLASQHSRITALAERLTLVERAIKKDAPK